MKLVWIILAATFAVAAFILVLRGDYDKAFITAALGAVTWFLSYRVQMKQLTIDTKPEEELDEDLPSDEKE